MTSRQRIECALAHREPDRTPVFEYVLLSPVADQLLGRPYAADPANWDGLVREVGWEAAVRRRASDTLDLAAMLGHDMLYVVPNAPPPVGHVPAAQRTAPEPTDDPVERVQRRNASSAVESHIADEILAVYGELRTAMRQRDMDLPILAPAYAHGVWTDADLMQTMVLAPEVAHEHFRHATRHSLALIEKYIAAGVDQIGVGGDFAGTRPIISPRAYREFIVPEVRTLSRRIHAANLRAINASDGNLWPVLDDFVDGCNVDGYLEIDMHAGMDLKRLKAACGDRVTLYGNLDCGTTLSFGSQAEVRAHVIECIEAGMGNGGHILCASNAITASVPLANYLAVVDAYRSVFVLPALPQ
jgi:hypothetical protein